MKKVCIVMGSDSDLPVVTKAINVLGSFEVPFEVHVLSAHRSPLEVATLSRFAKDNGIGVIIACAGMAAHLAGAVAANTILPVIAVPIKSAALDGLDALLSSVMMPSGVPVATVAIDGSANAAYLAVQILAVSDEALSKRFADFKENQHMANIQKNKAIEAEYTAKEI